MPIQILIKIHRFFFISFHSKYRYKDDKPYPWNIEVSSLILYPEAANQTIYTREARQQDAGIYKCVLRNETHKTEHSIELNIQGK